MWSAWFCDEKLYFFGIIIFPSWRRVGCEEFLNVLLWPWAPGNKLTQKVNADSGVQVITPAGPRQSLLLAKDPDQFLWKPYIP